MIAASKQRLWHLHGAGTASPSATCLCIARQPVKCVTSLAVACVGSWRQQHWAVVFGFGSGSAMGVACSLICCSSPWGDLCLTPNK